MFRLKYMRRKITKISVFLILSLLFISSFPKSTNAITYKSSDRIHITNLHLLTDDLYAFGSYISIDGQIDGDLISGAYEVDMNGVISGSQNIFAYNYYHRGKTDGAVRIFAYSSTIDGYIGRSLLAFTNMIRIGQGSVIEKDAVVIGNAAYVEGTISGNFKFEGGSVHLSGLFNRDVEIVAGRISISPPAIINGDFTYTAENKINFDTLTGVTVLGETTWKEPIDDADKEESGSSWASIVKTGAFTLGAFIFGIILIHVFKRYTEETLHQLKTRLPVAVASGFITFLAAVASIVLLIISLLLFLIGMIMIKGDPAVLGALILIFSIPLLPIFSFASLSGALLFYTGKIVMATMVGYWIIRILKSNPAAMSKSQLLLGLIILMLLFCIPYAGTILYLLACITGSGAIILGIRKCRRDNNVSETVVSTEKQLPDTSNQ